MPDENVLTMELTPVIAKRILREIIEADNGGVFFKEHALERMSERNITRRQVICCINHGQFIEEPNRSTNRNWQMKLKVISAGDPISVVCALDNNDSGNYIIVITAI